MRLQSSPMVNGGGELPNAAYHPTLKELFLSHTDENAVEVYSTVDGHRVGSIAVPGPAGLSLSPDLSKLVIGTITAYVYVADPVTLHILSRLQIPTTFLTQNTQPATVNLPVAAYVMADGSILVGLGDTGTSGAGAASTPVASLLHYDPVADSFSTFNIGTGNILSNVSRTGDGKFILSLGFDTAIRLFKYSPNGSATASGPLAIIGATCVTNSDGSQTACLELFAQSGPRLSLFDGNLQLRQQQTISDPPLSGNLVFSRDGKYLYLMGKNSQLLVLNAPTGTTAGFVGVSIGSFIGAPTFVDADDNYHLMGVIQPEGAIVVNASQPQPSQSVIAQFGFATTEANPNVGPFTGGTQVQLVPQSTGAGMADGIASSMQAYFGIAAATQNTVAPYPSSSDHRNFLTATSPATTTPGPVTVLLTDDKNNAIFLPDVFTYGPHLLRIEPNTGAPQGGTRVALYGYGFGSPSSNDFTVTIGSTGALVNSFNAFFGTIYPEQALTVFAPGGTPGWTDITLATHNGSHTVKSGFYFLQKTVSVNGGPFSFVAYDPVRDRFYLSGHDNAIAVFDANTQTFLQPLTSGLVSGSAVLQGIAITPDSSKLVVSDPADHIAVIFDLVNGTSTAANVLLPSDPPTTKLMEPMSVVATNDRAFVTVTPCLQNTVRQILFSNFAVSARADVPTICTDNKPYPEYGAATADGSTILFAGNLPLSNSPTYLWRYDTASDNFTGPVILTDQPWVGGHAAVNSDGTVMASAAGTLDDRLYPLVPCRGAFSPRLNSSGSLMYSIGPLSTSSYQVLVCDTTNGRLLLSLGVPEGPSGFQALAIDPSGTKILVSTQTGVSYYELAAAPLALSRVLPPSAPVGWLVQLRGSGFVPGTVVKMGGQAATCLPVDSETMSCTVPNLGAGAVVVSLTNPGGETTSVEHAFVIP